MDMMDFYERYSISFDDPIKKAAFELFAQESIKATEQLYQKKKETLEGLKLKGIPKEDTTMCIAYQRIGNTHNYNGLVMTREKTQEEKDGKVFVDYVKYTKNEKGETIASEITRREKTKQEIEAEIEADRVYLLQEQRPCLKIYEI